MEYYPHKGEELPADYSPSPVLLVKRVRSFATQPYWHKNTLDRLGEQVVLSVSLAHVSNDIFLHRPESA